MTPIIVDTTSNIESNFETKQSQENVILGTSLQPSPNGSLSNDADESNITDSVLVTPSNTKPEDSLNSFTTTADATQCNSLSSCYNETDRRKVPKLKFNGRLPPEYYEEAEDDLHEKQAWLDQDVLAMKEMLAKEEGLVFKQDSSFLLSFLRARKFDYEKAHRMCVGYYRSRQENHSFYENLTAQSLTHVWSKQIQTVLPTTDQKGRTVILFRTGLWNPLDISLDDVFRAQMLLLEHVSRSPITQLKGVTTVMDCSGMGRSHASHLTATHIKKILSVIQDVFPLRFKALHFVNEPLMFELMFSVVKPFLSETIKKRLHFHGSNIKGLYHHIQQDTLPAELGGSVVFDNSELVSLLQDQEQYFKDHFSYGYCGPLLGDAIQSPMDAPTKPQSVSDSMSDVGSFFGSYYRKKCI